MKCDCYNYIGSFAIAKQCVWKFEDDEICPSVDANSSVNWECDPRISDCGDQYGVEEEVVDESETSEDIAQADTLENETPQDDTDEKDTPQEDTAQKDTEKEDNSPEETTTIDEEELDNLTSLKDADKEDNQLDVVTPPSQQDLTSIMAIFQQMLGNMATAPSHSTVPYPPLYTTTPFMPSPAMGNPPIININIQPVLSNSVGVPNSDDSQSETDNDVLKYDVQSKYEPEPGSTKLKDEVAELERLKASLNEDILNLEQQKQQKTLSDL